MQANVAPSQVLERARESGLGLLECTKPLGESDRSLQLRTKNTLKQTCLTYELASTGRKWANLLAEAAKFECQMVLLEEERMIGELQGLHGDLQQVRLILESSVKSKRLESCGVNGSGEKGDG